jgi:hypothetical protein
MRLATYAIVAVGSRRGILHDGNVEGDHVTKESAFEAAVAAPGLLLYYSNPHAGALSSVRRRARPN